MNRYRSIEWGKTPEGRVYLIGPNSSPEDLARNEKYLADLPLQRARRIALAGRIIFHVIAWPVGAAWLLISPHSFLTLLGVWFIVKWFTNAKNEIVQAIKTRN